MNLSRRGFFGLLAAGALSFAGCSALGGLDRRCPNPKADLLAEAKRLVALDRASLTIDCPHEDGHRITLPGYNGNGTFTMVAGVWIEDAIYYEALGVGTAYSTTMRRIAAEHKGTMIEREFRQHAEDSDRLRDATSEVARKPYPQLVIK